MARENYGWERYMKGQIGGVEKIVLIKVRKHLP